MTKHLLKIVIVVGIAFLLLEAGVVLGSKIIPGTQTNNLDVQSESASANRDWTENFDSYETGSALHGQGGWAGWDNNAAATGYVSDVQSHSSPNSVEIQWYSGVAADMVHEYTDVNSGVWTYTAWQYVPSTMVGTQFFILMNTYTAGGTHNNPDWSLQLEISASGGYIRDYNNIAASLPLVTNEWVKLQVVIDFDADVQTVYYNDVQFIQKSWKDGVSPGGAQNLACVDLFGGNTVTTAMYYDDLSLAPPVPPLTCDADGPYFGVNGQPIEFLGSAEGGVPPYAWEWQFGDGTTATVQNPTHVYATPGVYNVTLTVTDTVSTIATDETTATITKAPEPEIEIGTITGGKGISVKIKNTGDADASMVNWSISLDKGLLLKGRTKTGTILELNINEEKTVASSVLGFGKVSITVTAGDKEKQASGFAFLIFVLGVK